MRHTAVAGHLKPEEIKERMLSSESRQQFQRWQVIYITVTKRLKAEAVSELVGVCTGTIHQWGISIITRGQTSLYCKDEVGVGGSYYRGMKRKNYWKCFFKTRHALAV